MIVKFYLKRIMDKNNFQNCDSLIMKNGMDKDQELAEQVKIILYTNLFSLKAQVPASNVEIVIGPELLSEILNKKKMELLRSPEVKDFLMQQQSKLSGQLLHPEQGVKSKKESSSSDDARRNDKMSSSSSQFSPKR